jgi:hypothetical protein
MAVMIGIERAIAARAGAPARTEGEARKAAEQEREVNK